MVTGTVAAVRRWTAEIGALPTRWSDGFAGTGLTVALVATLALGGAAVLGLDETSSEGHGRVTASGEPIGSEQPAMAPQEQLRADPQGSPDTLVATYMPELAFRADQLWLPESVDGYVDGAWLERPRGDPVQVHSVADLPGPDDCPGLTQIPCYRLTIRCPTADDPCSGAHPVGDGSIDHPEQSGAVYVRVVRRRQHPELFPDDVGEFAGQKPWMLIEYWYFYRYDEWKSPVLAGSLVQRHEGDWESVMVGLSSRSRCSSPTRSTARRVAAVVDDRGRRHRRPRTHPSSPSPRARRRTTVAPARASRRTGRAARGSCRRDRQPARATPRTSATSPATATAGSRRPAG